MSESVEIWTLVSLFLLQHSNTLSLISVLMMSNSRSVEHSPESSAVLWWNHRQKSREWKGSSEGKKWTDLTVGHQGKAKRDRPRCLQWIPLCPLHFFLLQLKVKKKKLASDQEQLVSKLDKALSLTQRHNKLKSPFKFADSCVGRSKNGAYSSSSRYLSSHEALVGKDGKKSLVKTLSFSLKASKEGKNKMATKMKKMEVGIKVKGHLKVSPAISEGSSYSYSK